MSLAGKLAFVTGAGSGIGRAACQTLAREGATIIAADKNVKHIEETLSSLSKNSNNSHIRVGVDVGNTPSIQKALNDILERYSQPPTIIVNCAGITRDNWVLKLSEEDFKEVLNVNLTGTFRVVQIFANSIVNNNIKNASIINIASIVGKSGNLGQANYCASKSGVELFTKVSAKELGVKGIRVNSVLPGMIKTPMIDAVPDKVKDKFMTLIPLARFGQPEEVAEVIAFLASDKSSYITGASIEVTGGFGM